MTLENGLPAGRAIALDGRVRIWGDAAVLLGGAPWGVLRIATPARPFVRTLAAHGARGAVPATEVELALAKHLLARGIVHPVATAGRRAEVPVDVVVPAYQGPELLQSCLTALRRFSPNARVIVVDDGSTGDDVADVVRAAGAVLLRHTVNRGPAAARNTGLREATAPIVAFVDADCEVTPGWLEPLLSLFDDPRVAAAAPRIRPRSPSHGMLTRYQAEWSALDMGPRPESVTFGAALGYLPSAALLVRRAAIAQHAFDEDLRLGEDVDLVWRLIEEGWLVRYEPAATVSHEARSTIRGWARRIFDYGTSAAALDRRHPRRLTPARFSGWNLAIAALLLARRPPGAVRMPIAAVVGAVTCALAARMLRFPSTDPRVAALMVAKKAASDGGAAGHLLRREWWPLGWLTLLCSRRSRTALAASAAMLIPVVREWRSRPQELDLPRYLVLRLIADAAYGTGVIAGAVTGRRPEVLLPQIRFPYLPGRT